MAEKEKPAHTIRVGRIKVKIWRNVTKENRPWFNTQIVRLYTENGDTNEKETTQFGYSDLLAVSKVAQMAFDWISAQDRSAGSDETNE
jgi:hypothetical protein